MRGKLGWVAMAAVVGGLAAAAVVTSGPPQAEAAAAGYPLDQVGFASVTTGLDQPVDIAFTGLLTDTRLFAVERHGHIKIVQPGGAILPTPFLNVTGNVSTAGEEEGLLGLAFAPDYGVSGDFYVYYVTADGDLQLSRFQVSADPNVADPNETGLLTIPHPDCRNHNGGDLNFGPDGFLYLAPGDGGGLNDTCGGLPSNDNDAQRLNSLLGKVLRLNVTGVPTYTIPPSNPFTQTVGARPEIWAWGLRNPWRFSFDRLAGDLYIADVGQYQIEELNVQPAGSAGGENYGWRCFEGPEPYITNCGTTGPYTMPVFSYAHDLGSAIVGGFVYWGSAYAPLNGYYFFADAMSGRFWARGGCGPAVTDLGQLLGTANPTSFGQDAAGNIYVATLSGAIYRLVGPAAAPPPVILTPVFLPLVNNGPC